MKKILTFILLLVVFGAFSQTTYYVDSDGGNDANTGLSPAQAWQNIERLDTTTVLNYGDSVLLQRGDTWSGRINITSTYWPNGVVIGAYGTGAKPKINGNGVGNNEPTLKVFGLGSIKITYLEMDVGGLGTYGIWADDTDSLYVDSCIIYNNDQNNIVAHLIVVTDQPWVSITNNVLHTSGMEGFYGGIFAEEDGPCLFEGNYVYNINNSGDKGDCIQLNLSCPSVHIIGNYLDHRNSSVFSGKGSLVLTQDTGYAYNVLIKDNVFLSDSGDSYSFSFGRAKTFPGSKGVRAYNNYSYADHNSGSSVTGTFDTLAYNILIGFGNGVDCRINDTVFYYHIYNNYIAPIIGVPLGRLVLADFGDTNFWYFKNNICYFEDRFNLNATYEKDYNIYFDPSGSEPNSIYNNTSAFWDTLFIDTFDINPNSLAVDAGIDVGLKFDYRGNPVPYNSVVDIGVNEYTPSSINCDTATFLYTTTITPDTNLGSKGAIDLLITDGATPFTYSWSSGETTEDISNKLAGNYTVTITDVNNCTNDSTFTIPNYIPICDTTVILLTATITPDTNLGSKGAIDLSVSGGEMPYGYSWSSGETVQDISSKLAGNYTVTVTDNNNCTNDSTFTIPNIVVEVLDTIDWAVDTITRLWVSKINSAIAKQNITTEPDLDTITLGSDTFVNWALIINALIKEFSNDTIIYGTDNLEGWRVKINTAIKQIE